jgi:hypothetical protein
MGFKASEAVPKLEWDFTEYVPGAKGVSPEPSNLSILNFNLNIRSLVDATRRIKTAQVEQSVAKANGATKEEKEAELAKWSALDLEKATLEVLDEMTQIVPAAEGEEIQRKEAKLVAELLQDCPSEEQIMGLPGRVRQAYFGWIAGQLMDPEFGAAGTNS